MAASSGDGDGDIAWLQKSDEQIQPLTLTRDEKEKNIETVQ